MSKYKKAMTLAEILVTFIAMGIIATMAISTVKPFKKTQRHLYLRVYNALAEAAYNAVLDDSTMFSADSPENLCKGLISYINSSPDSCQSITTTNLIEDTQKDFSQKTVHMLANNSMRFYFSKLRKMDSTDSGNSSTLEIKYFIVYVDLNGESGPNTALWSEKTPNDVVAFALISTGDVVPLGRPQLDTSYLIARVFYPPTTTNPKGSYSDSMSFYKAKCMAWGCGVYNENKQSLNFNSAFSTESPLIITTTQTFDVDTANGCSTGSASPCDVTIENNY